MEYTYLLSYPRSGNHWIRYIIEWFSGMYTTGDIYADDSMTIDDDSKLVNPGDPPLFKKCDMPILHVGPIVKKRHKIYKGENKDKKLILIQRDYRESVIRQLNIMQVDINKGNFSTIKIELDKYIDSINTYNTWEREKLLINYNDLKDLKKDSVRKLLSFLLLDIDEAKIDLFFNNIEFHKKNAFSAVGAKNDTSFYSSGNIFHSLKIESDILNDIDKYIKNKLNK